ncbi:MAG: hypothetical protein R3D34_15425 [Nitratireductor sp.]
MIPITPAGCAFRFYSTSTPHWCSKTQFTQTHKAGGLVTLVGLLALKGPLPMAGMTMSDPISLAAGSFAGLCILLRMLTAFPRYPDARSAPTWRKWTGSRGHR